MPSNLKLGESFQIVVLGSKNRDELELGAACHRGEQHCGERPDRIVRAGPLAKLDSKATRWQRSRRAVATKTPGGESESRL
jgi:hypothetical protein